VPRQTPPPPLSLSKPPLRVFAPRDVDIVDVDVDGRCLARNTVDNGTHGNDSFARSAKVPRDDIYELLFPPLQPLEASPPPTTTSTSSTTISMPASLPLTMPPDSPFATYALPLTLPRSTLTSPSSLERGLQAPSR
jgi:hypothetical protein